MYLFIFYYYFIFYQKFAKICTQQEDIEGVQRRRTRRTKEIVKSQMRIYKLVVYKPTSPYTVVLHKVSASVLQNFKSCRCHSRSTRGIAEVPNENYHRGRKPMRRLPPGMAFSNFGSHIPTDTTDREGHFITTSICSIEGSGMSEIISQTKTR